MKKRILFFLLGCACASIVFMLFILPHYQRQEYDFSRFHVLAEATKKDAYGTRYSVTACRLDAFHRVELLYGGKCPVSSFTFWEGSIPATKAVITWTNLESFSVAFHNGVTVRCTWAGRRASWERN